MRLKEKKRMKEFRLRRRRRRRRRRTILRRGPALASAPLGLQVLLHRATGGSSDIKSHLMRSLKRRMEKRS